MADYAASRVTRVIAAGPNVVENATPETTRQFPQPGSPGGRQPARRCAEWRCQGRLFQVGSSNTDANGQCTNSGAVSKLSAESG